MKKASVFQNFQKKNAIALTKNFHGRNFDQMPTSFCGTRELLLDGRSWRTATTGVRCREPLREVAISSIDDSF